MEGSDSLATRVLRQVLHLVRPVLGPVAQLLADHLPMTSARVVALATRTLAAQPQSTSQRTALYLSRHAPRDLGSVTMTYFGVEFVLDLRDNLQRDLYYLGRYERELLEFLLGEVRPADIFVDVGAHIGTFALPIARRLTGTGRVIAFEPAADTAATLQQNADRNGIELTIVRSALGSNSRTDRLRHSTSSAYLPQDLGVRTLHGEGPVVAEVPVIPFDSWVADSGIDRVDLVKIDVEGSECEVLEGMQASLEAFKPRLIVIEVVDSHLARSGASAELLARVVARCAYQSEGPSIAELASSRTGPFWPNAVLRPLVQPGGEAATTP